MKINRTKTVTSLQPDTRNGHKPPITTQFWGDKSVAIKNTVSGKGRKPKPKPEEPKTKMWWEDLHSVDECTLKAIIPKVKYTPPAKKQKTLDDLVAAFQGR